jgi:glycosyltransferase involved in cell wall biosynthesis
MRKQILILGHNYATQFIDIYNQYTRLFDQDKYEVTVAYLSGEPDAEVRKRTIAENVLFLNFPKASIRMLKISAIRRLLGICREKNFEIVICHRYKPAYIMMWVAQWHKIPALVFVMHELGTMSSVNRRMLIACLARKNMLFAGVSNAVRDDMRKDLWRVPPERVATLYNMLDVEMTEPNLLEREAARKALNLPDDAFVFGTIGRLAKNKNQKNLIHAFSLIKVQYPRAKLIIIGDGVLEDSLREQVKAYGLNDDVILTGFLAGGYRYMKAFDCFVLPSTQEAFGRVLLEAMIAKLPVIAARVHGIPEVVADAGTLINPHNSDELADAMRHIAALTSEARAQLGEYAHQHVVSHFSIPKFHEQFWQLPLIAGNNG